MSAQGAQPPGSPGCTQQPASADKLPQGLSSTDWSSIRAAYEAGRQAAFAVPGGYDARNPGQQWLTHFDGRGFNTVPDAGGWTWGLQLERYGFAGKERAVTAPTKVSAAGDRVAYDWDASLQEWYVNDSRGLEQGFTVQQRPPQDRAGPLTVTLAVRGELSARIQADGRSVVFVNCDGAPVLTYAGLKVSDADGQPVAAHFALAEEDLLISIDECDARYPLTIDPTVQHAYLKASNTDSADNFGTSVAMSGDTVVVGAVGEDSNATGVNGNESDNSAGASGAAYVFVRNGTSWSQEAYLKASNTDPFDFFGSSVSVSGDTVVVGAWGESSLATGVNGYQLDNSAPYAGAAYVFARTGTSWSQQGYLKPSSVETNDRFGGSVSVSGDTVIVGDPGEYYPYYFGSAYVFVRSGVNWSQQAVLSASNFGVDDYFGGSVAVSGDTAVVGAWGESSNATGVNGNQSDNSAFAAGAAYVFVRSGTSWSQQAYLKASNTGAGDGFGSSVSNSSDTVVVGAPYKASNAGAAYVFARSGTSWSPQASLQASNAEAQDQFGYSVSVSGDTVVVGAPLEDSDATGVNGDQSDDSAIDSGAAYLFARTGTFWSSLTYLKASNAEAYDNFGQAVAVSGSTAVVGALVEDSNATGVNNNQGDNSLSGSGAAYILDLDTKFATAVNLVSGTTGAFSALTYAGTHGVDVTVQAPLLLHVTSMTLTGLEKGANPSILVGARIYNSSSGTLVASADATVTSTSNPLTIPIEATLNAGGTYRIAFVATTTFTFKITGSLFDPDPAGPFGFPYDEATGWMRINAGVTDAGDAFPNTGSTYVPQIKVNATMGDFNWTDLGNAKAGGVGIPALSGTGILSTGSTNQLNLTGAKKNSPAALFFGISQLDAPFKGGVLVPSPLVTVPLVTGPSGKIPLPFVLPSGVPPDFSFYFQFWIQDAGASHGFSASNGLRGVTS